jgi:hypothetical protein
MSQLDTDGSLAGPAAVGVGGWEIIAIKRHLLAPGYEIEIKPVLDGLRHQYRLKKVA